MSNNTNSQRMKRAVEILKKTQGKTSFKRSGQPKKSTKYARAVKKQTNRAAQRKALNAQQPVYNFEKQRNAVRELQKLIGKRPPSLNRNRLQSMAKRRRVNNKNSNKTSPIGRLNSNFAPIVRNNNNNNNNRNANANVNVFRNKNNIVRVRRTSNNVHGTKNRWKHKLKTGSTSKNDLKNKHGNKNWHRHRPVSYTHLTLPTILLV